MKYLLPLIALMLLTGCSNMTSEKCKSLGYTHEMHNLFNNVIGCSKIDGELVEHYNAIKDVTFVTHIENSGQMYLIK